MKRRHFIKNSAMAGAGLLATSSAFASELGFNSGSNDTLKIALIGCGGRGSRAVLAALKYKDVPCELVAMCDLFKDKIDEKHNAILTAAGANKSKIKVTEDTKFVGYQGYKDAIAMCDIVFIGTPASSKPVIFAESIKQNKHVFMEKPVCVDSLGFQSILQTAALATQKKRYVASGLQRRYSEGYRQMIAEIQDGAIGDIHTAECYWMGGPIGQLGRPRKEGWTEMEYQNRHWRSFSWVSGGNIEEFHVHNLDIINWALGELNPESVIALGGKNFDRHYSSAVGGFDYITSNFKYKNGVSLHSYSRNSRNCKTKNGEYLYGTKGKAVMTNDGFIYNNKGKLIFTAESKKLGKFHGSHNKVQEKLIDSIYNSKPYYNEAVYAAHSTMTGTFGRMSAWSGKEMIWDEAVTSKVQLFDYNDQTSLNSVAPILPNANGEYPVPIPGKTKVM
ncbi:Gfo/Idh/MocA family oxidoreductase [uncultured Algibacter sp.]|uniref:Gfo/Idh/MocA family protein n=1 Tax=uncultured Algibacter sp. TaxID=298659 RepID=UPI002622CA11|nr:Gfo/Idh/MocA family oxidoreductase [uncultured Algibacter sp.]